MARKRKLEATGADRTELRTLLAAAKADHWDDGPRLAIADWLEENGNEADRARAEVIRLQLDEADGGPAWTNAVEKLREKHVRDWVPAHRDFFRLKLPLCERGLLMAQAGGVSWPVDHGPTDEGWDWVETAKPSSVRTAELPDLLASQRMATVPTLDLGEKELGTGGIRVLCKHLPPGVRRLRLQVHPGTLPEFARRLPPGREELAITSRGYRAAVLESLFRSAGTEGLRHLSLGYGLSQGEVAQMARRAGLAGLRRLALYHSGLTPAGVRSLATLALRRLILHEAHCGSSGLAGLADSPCSAALEEFRLEGCALVGMVPTSLRLPRLRRLSIVRCRLDQPGLISLAGMGLLEGLAELNLSHNPVGPEGVVILASVARGPRSLRLENANLGNSGARRLMAWPGLARVRYLDLAGNRLDDAGVTALADSPHVAAVEALSLANNPSLRPAGLSALLRSPLGARLRWLSLESLTTPPRMADAIAHNPPPNLRELHLGLPAVYAIGKTGMARLRAALPQCAIG